MIQFQFTSKNSNICGSVQFTLIISTTYKTMSRLINHERGQHEPSFESSCATNTAGVLQRSKCLSRWHFMVQMKEPQVTEKSRDLGLQRLSWSSLLPCPIKRGSLMCRFNLTTVPFFKRKYCNSTALNVLYINSQIRGIHWIKNVPLAVAKFLHFNIHDAVLPLNWPSPLTL